jgi:hypothetical protein
MSSFKLVIVVTRAVSSMGSSHDVEDSKAKLQFELIANCRFKSRWERSVYVDETFLGLRQQTDQNSGRGDPHLV